MYTFAQAAQNRKKRGQAQETKERPATVNQSNTSSPSDWITETSAPKPEPVLPDLEAVGEITFQELAKGSRVVKMWSQVLNDTILLVPDSYHPRAEDPVCYNAQEVEILFLAKTDEDRRTIHAVKKMTRGKMIYAGKENQPETDNTKKEPHE
jgi:hypothetical protein